jgi:transcriptional regulatory protein RtcR
MATLCDGGRMGVRDVDEEIERLHTQWRGGDAVAGEAEALAVRLLGKKASSLDHFELVQLEEVLRVCRSARSLSEAGRTLFAASRASKSSVNDADRLRKYLTRYGLTLQAIQAA